MSLTQRLGAVLQALRDPAPAPSPAPLAKVTPAEPTAPVATPAVMAEHTFQALAKAWAPMFKGRTTEIAAARDVGIGGALAEDAQRLSYQELRALADQADLIGLAIDDVKQRVRGLGWEIEREDGGTVNPDAVALLESPDGVSSWDEWSSQLVEEYLVCDNPTIQPIYKGGPLVRAELIDGATIKVKVDDLGRIPRPPAVAYEQKQRGRVAPLTFTTDELWYLPQNRRLRSTRGYSPVEKIAVRAAIVWRKLFVEMARWNKGGVPVGFMGVPDNWPLKDVKDYQTWMDDRMTNPANQARIQITAGQPRFASVTPTTIDKNGEELLIRIVCWAMGVDPTSLVSQVNYSTAAATERWAAARGIMPVLWLLERVARLIFAAAGHQGHRLVWPAQRQAEAEAKRDKRLERYKAGLLSWEELRGDDGDSVDVRDVARLHFWVLGDTAERFDPFAAPLAAVEPWPGGAAAAAAARAAGAEARPAPALPAGGGVEALQDTALNGAQVTAAVEIVTKVAARELPRETGLGMLQAFFNLSPDQAARIMGTVGASFFAEPAPAPVPPQLQPPAAKQPAGDNEEEDLGKVIRGDLRRWRQREQKALAKSLPRRPFESRVIPAWVRFRVEDALGKGMPIAQAFGDQLRKVKVAGVEEDAAAAKAAKRLEAWWEKYITTLLEHYQAAVLKAVDGVLAKGSRAPDLPPPAYSEDIWAELIELLEDAYEAGDTMAAGIVGYGSKAARTYAERRAAELLGRRWNGSEWVERAGLFSVPDQVRQEVHDLVVKAMDNGWDVGTLNNELYLKFESTPGRSLTIARTETGMAYNEATVASYDVAGVQHVLTYDGPGCLLVGHDDDAELPDEGIIGAQLDRQANGQILTIAEAKQYSLGHPNCGRVYAPYLPAEGMRRAA